MISCSAFKQHFKKLSLRRIPMKGYVEPESTGWPFCSCLNGTPTLVQLPKRITGHWHYRVLNADLVSKPENIGLSMVAHACNPNYSGGRDWEDHSFEASLGKKFARRHLNQQAAVPAMGESQVQDPI
jgi:hypothetical protein